MKVNELLCDICGTCVAVCPVDAIRVSEFRVRIEQDVCIQCGKCEQVCPARAISGEAS